MSSKLDIPAASPEAESAEIAMDNAPINEAPASSRIHESAQKLEKDKQRSEANKVAIKEFQAKLDTYEKLLKDTVSGEQAVDTLLVTSSIRSKCLSAQLNQSLSGAEAASFKNYLSQEAYSRVKTLPQGETLASALAELGLAVQE